MSRRAPETAAAAFAALLLAGAAPRDAEPLVLDCYVSQSGPAGPGPFVRHLQIDRERAVVSIADAIAGGGIRYVGNARLIALDPAQIVYDFAAANSGGRTTIDRRTGRFDYGDGRVVIRGQCR